MHILVPIKVVPDYKIKLQLTAEQNTVNLNGVKMILNPFDAIALQAAIDLKKKHPDTTITSLLIGPTSISQQIRESLALGADRAIHIETEQSLVSLSIAKILKHTVEQQPDINLVLMGKQAIDTDSNQTAPMLAKLLNWPSINYISDISINNNNIHTTCEWDDGLVNIEAALPAVVSCDLRLNTPSPANMMAIMKAKQKPVETFKLDDLNLNLKQHQTIKTFEKPASRQESIKLEDINQLVDIINTKKEQI